MTDVLPLYDMSWGLAKIHLLHQVVGTTLCGHPAHRARVLGCDDLVERRRRAGIDPRRTR